MFQVSGDFAQRVLNDDPALESSHMSKVSREVLDFSSGSEEDEEEQGLKIKTSKRRVLDDNRGGNAATDSVRLSLFQQGFSKFFERVEGKPELAEEDSSLSVDESPVEESSDDQVRQCTSSSICNTRNKTLSLTKLGTKTSDISTSSDKDKENAGKVQIPKGQANERITEDEESDDYPSQGKNKPHQLKSAVPEVYRFEDCSDESQDLDIEEMKCPKREDLNACGKRGATGRGRLVRNRKWLSSSVREKGRSKYSEDIETYTSSEDEHNPVKKGRTTSGHYKFQQTDRTRVQLPKDGPKSATAQSTESLKTRTYPTSKGKGGTIDCVLGKMTYISIHIF